MQDETLQILTEECAEVIQAISKCQRFGMDAYKPGSPKTNREHLEEELGDLLCMIHLASATDTVKMENLDLAKQAKLEKLKCWSTIDPSILNKQTYD
jgi:NTP pyrophosphatase (non-canonical NTP hydrolase)